MEIVIGPIYSSIVENISIVDKILTYKGLIYRQGKYGGKYYEYPKPMLKNNRFLTGLVPRVVRELSLLNIPIKYTILSPAPKPTITPLKSKKLYDYQEEAVNTALTKKRGVIVASTGSGKTVIAMGIMKCFPTQNILFIVPTIDLMSQSYQRFVEEFPTPDIGIIGDGTYEPSRISISIVNSLHSRIEDPFLQSIGVIILDEAHHTSKHTGMYAKVLQRIPASFRIGLTATLPESNEALWTMESNIGPVITTIKTDHLIDIGKLSTPKIRIVKIPFDAKVKNITKYKEGVVDKKTTDGITGDVIEVTKVFKKGAYEEGVVRSVPRNNIIADEVAKEVSNGNTCLIIVTIIEHGQNILKTIQAKYPQIKVLFAYGKTEAEDRERTKDMLNRKEIDCVITSTIWREGIDIPTLNTVINAAGSESDVFIQQIAGRGMRVADGKDYFTLIDFFDYSSAYFIKHFGKRLCLYYDKGWL